MSTLSMATARPLVRQNSGFPTQHAHESPRHRPRKPNCIVKVEYRSGFNKEING